jgi:hypothetical protein
MPEQNPIRAGITGSPTQLPCPMTRAEKVCWTITLLGAAAVVAPFAFEEAMEPLGDARFAGVMIGAMAGLTAFICAYMFRARGRVFERLRRGENLVARWTYAPDEWKSFAAEDDVRERSSKWKLFGIVAFFCVLFGVAFPFFDPENGWVVTMVMLGLVALIALVILATTSSRRRRMQGQVGDVKLGEDGLLLAGELHIWKGWGARLEEVSVLDGNPPCLAFTYSTPSKNSRQITTVRVPIPRGKDAEAADVAARFVAKLPRKS